MKRREQCTPQESSSPSSSSSEQTTGTQANGTSNAFRQDQLRQSGGLDVCQEEKGGDVPTDFDFSALLKEIKLDTPPSLHQPQGRGWGMVISLFARFLTDYLVGKLDMGPGAYDRRWAQGQAQQALRAEAEKMNSSDVVEFLLASYLGHGGQSPERFATFGFGVGVIVLNQVGYQEIITSFEGAAAAMTMAKGIGELDQSSLQAKTIAAAEPLRKGAERGYGSKHADVQTYYKNEIVDLREMFGELPENAMEERRKNLPEFFETDPNQPTGIHIGGEEKQVGEVRYSEFVKFKIEHPKLGNGYPWLRASGPNGPEGGVWWSDEKLGRVGATVTAMGDGSTMHFNWECERGDALLVLEMGNNDAKGQMRVLGEESAAYNLTAKVDKGSVQALR